MYPSADGKYRFIVVYENFFDLSQYLPYYLLILAAVALLCWILATNLASPLRGLARVVDRFGAGDLSVRVNSSRKDEIGEVGRAFDRMAERIGTLLTAERRLLQDISHELRSPLARLSFAAELARTADDRDAAIARMNKEIARLTDLVGGLIQVTRAEGDPAANSSESLRLDQLLGEVVEDCQVEADARGCRIAFAGSRELTMHGDREVLRRAIENVVRNAIRYTPAGTSVDIQLDATADTARISRARLRPRRASRSAPENLPALLPRGRFALHRHRRRRPRPGHRLPRHRPAPRQTLGGKYNSRLEESGSNCLWLGDVSPRLNIFPLLHRSVNQHIIQVQWVR